MFYTNMVLDDDGNAWALMLIVRRGIACGSAVIVRLGACSPYMSLHTRAVLLLCVAVPVDL